MDKVNRAFKDSYGLSKHFKKEDRSENDNLNVRSELLPIKLFNTVPGSILQIPETILSDEIQYIPMDNINRIPECEFIAKPEEAGGINIYIFI